MLMKATSTIGMIAILQLLLAGSAAGAAARNVKTGAIVDGPSSSAPSATLTGSPASVEQEYAGRLDLSIGKTMGVGFEGNVKNDREEAEGEALADAESRRAEGMGAAIFVSAFTGRRPLTGFYGALGAGYRKEAVKWQVAPDDNDPNVDLSLVKSDQKLHHAAELKGPTAHVRAGYRFVVPETPLLLGGYVGGRYFQAAASDADESSSPSSAPMTESEKDRLAKEYAAKVEAAVEVGFAF